MILIGDMMKICASCGKQTANATVFKCPECSAEVARCQHCKKMAIKYKCACGFEGP